MANVKQCDICGRIYPAGCSADYNGFRFVHTNSGDVVMQDKVKDCCPDCMRDLKRFFEDRKVIVPMAREKLHAARDILTAHPFVDTHPGSAIKAAVKELDEVLDD